MVLWQRYHVFDPVGDPLPYFRGQLGFFSFRQIIIVLGTSSVGQHEKIEFIIQFETVVSQDLSEVLTVRRYDSLLHPQFAPVRVHGRFPAFDEARQ